MNQSIKYNFYATLLDKFESYINSSQIYQEYWGFAENPEKSEFEFEQEQFKGLIDTINRVPFESELADKGTAFNEVIDCLIQKRKSDKMDIKSYKDKNEITVKFKEHTFSFNINLCKEFASYFSNGILQYRCENTLETKYGKVLLCGNIDVVMPFSIHDIKTTKKYNAFKFRNNWQHIVYPYCTGINEFEYNITDLKNIWTEGYNFNLENHLPKLINHCELLIEFIEANKNLITDKKIFGNDLPA
jgi:hypothetical protein